MTGLSRRLDIDWSIPEFSGLYTSKIIISNQFTLEKTHNCDSSRLLGHEEWAYLSCVEI